MEQKKLAAIEYMPDLLVFKNPNARLVDSVPYLDGQKQYSDEMKSKVAKMVSQQMKSMEQRDYLKDLP